MKKSEKIIAFCFTFSFVLVLVSCVYTIYKNKPEGGRFVIEKFVNLSLTNP